MTMGLYGNIKWHVCRDEYGGKRIIVNWDVCGRTAEICQTFDRSFWEYRRIPLSAIAEMMYRKVEQFERRQGLLD